MTESGPDEPEWRATGSAGTTDGDTATGAGGAPVVVPEGSSFGDLYLRTFSSMVRLARVLVDSPEIAEDLVQDAFVRLHRHWGGVRDPGSYLHRSVVNACRSHRRRAWRERLRAPGADGPSA
jgi:DNA-directed RNA polymerase specialized sigma24 family protein